jgi:large conductance mechanosensitive channel
VISFLLIAVRVYFLAVLPVNRLMAQFRTEPEPASQVRECRECLSKIPAAASRCAFCGVEVRA